MPRATLSTVGCERRRDSEVRLKPRIRPPVPRYRRSKPKYTSINLLGIVAARRRYYADGLSVWEKGASSTTKGTDSSTMQFDSKKKKKRQ